VDYTYADLSNNYTFEDVEDEDEDVEDDEETEEIIEDPDVD
jgi:hypothetical protein